MKMRMLLVLLVFGSNVAAASDEGEFTGCDAPRSKVDQAVCADPELRGLRVRMEGLLDTIHAGTLHTNGDTGVMVYGPLKKTGYKKPSGLVQGHVTVSRPGMHDQEIPQQDCRTGRLG